MKFGTNKDFILPFDLISDICSAIDRSPSKTVINFVSDGKTFCIYASSDGFTTYYSQPVNLGWYISCAVDATRFTTLIKKLYEGDISCKVVKNKMKVKKDNIKAEFQLQNAVPLTFDPQFVYINSEPLIKSLESFSRTGIKEDRFPGVLVDGSNPANCKVSKLSSHIIRITALSKIFDNPCMFTVDEKFLRILSYFSKDIENVFINQNIFGISLKSGIITYSSLIESKVSHNLINMFGLVDGSCLIDPQQYKCYKFDKNSFLSVLDLVSSVLGDEEQSVRMDIVGKDPGGNTVWKVSGKTFSGSSIEELVLCESDSDEQNSFSLNKKNLMKMLSLYEDEVFLYTNEKDSMVILSNRDGSDVSLLVKMVL